MDAVVEQLLESPRLALYVRRFEAVLEREKVARERFYNEMTEGEKLEFINGEVVVHSPVKKRHNDCVKRLLKLIDTYVEQHELGFVGVEKILITLTRNDYEPDLCFFSQDKAQGFRADQMKFPAPDFIVEVLSESTADKDRGVKFNDYAAHGVREYWLIDPGQETLEQYLLSADETYDLMLKSGSGRVKSVAVKGFEIPVRAVFDGAENLQALKTILS